MSKVLGSLDGPDCKATNTLVVRYFVEIPGYKHLRSNLSCMFVICSLDRGSTMVHDLERQRGKTVIKALQINAVKKSMKEKRRVSQDRITAIRDVVG